MAMNKFDELFIYFYVDKNDELQVVRMQATVVVVALLVVTISWVFLSIVVAALLNLLTIFVAGKLLSDIEEYRREEYLNDLHRKFTVALNDSNKSEALEGGREYYAAKRGGKLTIYDEQALANDIATMNK